MNSLPYRVKCKSSRPFFELMAAFDCESAAVGYAGDCALANMNFRYRVEYGSKCVKEFGPEAV